jgi:hypothetical protein
MILLNGAIPLPLAIMIKGTSGIVKFDSVIYNLIYFGMDLK